MHNLSLKKRVSTSTAWVFAGHMSSQILRLASNLIMTRLLVPDMFGVMALVTVFMMGIAMFSDVGLQQNIVQSKKGEDQSYLDTAWSVQILRGILIFIIALLISLALFFTQQQNFFPENSVYADPILPYVLAVMSFTAVLAGCNSVNLFLLNRKLLVGKVISIELFSQAIGLVVMVSVAWFWREIWVLVLAGLISAIAKMLLSHHSSLGDRCRFRIEKQHFHDIIHFGKWIFLGSILGFLLSQGDRLFLGAWLTPEMLGIYSIAFFMANAAREIMKKLAGSVFYPMLSEVFRENPEKIKSVYYRLRLRVDFLTMTAAGFLASSGSVIIAFLYDERYLESGWMFQVLSVSIVFVGFNMAAACLMARGDSKSHAIMMMVTVTVLFIGLPLAHNFYGLIGAIVFIGLLDMANIPTTLFMMKKAGILNIKREFLMLPMFFVAYFLGNYLVSLIS